MKKNHLWVLTVTLIGCLMAVSACSVDDNTVPKAKQVFLSKIIFKSFKPGTDEVVSATTQDFVWEKGLLKESHEETLFTVAGMAVTTTLDNYFTYEDGKCVEKKTITSSGGETIRTFTYNDNGQLTSGVEKISSGYARFANILSYTADGQIEQIEYIDETNTGKTIKRIVDLTWKDGNIVRYTIHNIEPADEDDTAEVTYDSYPSPFVGHQVATTIFEVPYQICSRISKNNPIGEGEAFIYKNGRVVLENKNSSVTYFFYSDGTEY